MDGHWFTGARAAAGRLCFFSMLIGLTFLSGCVQPVPPPEAALAGTWAFLTAAIDTEITQFSVALDETGNPTSVTYQLGNAAVATEAAAGSAGVNSGHTGVTAYFGDNYFTIDGQLDAGQKNISGFLSLRLEVGSVLVYLSRTAGTLSRGSGPVAGQNVLAGAWTLSVSSTQLYETLLEFDAQGNPTRMATKIGQSPVLIAVAPAGTVRVDSSNVTLDLSTFGGVLAPDTFRFNGQITGDGNLLEGTASLRASAGETTINVSETPATLVKLTPPPAGTATLQGAWDYKAFVPDPALTQLRLVFDSASLLTRLTYQIAGNDPVTIPGSAARTAFDSAIITVRSSSANDYFLFTGAIGSDQTTLVGYMSGELGAATLSQDPAIFVLSPAP